MDHALLLTDVEGEGRSRLPQMLRRPPPTKVLRGELLMLIPGDEIVPRSDGQKPHNYRVKKDPSISLYCTEQELAPLGQYEYLLLEAVSTPRARFSLFLSDNMLDWGHTLKAGDDVFVVVPGQTTYATQVMPQAAAKVRFVGGLGTGDDVPKGVFFGVEIKNKRYRGQGTTDGTYRSTRYFKCEDNCGLFVALDRLSPDHEGSTLSQPPPSGQTYTHDNNQAVHVPPLPSGRAEHERPPAAEPGAQDQPLTTQGGGTPVDPQFTVGDQVMGHNRMPEYRKSQSLPLQPRRQATPYDDIEPHYNSGNFKDMGESHLDRQRKDVKEALPDENINIPKPEEELRRIEERAKKRAQGGESHGGLHGQGRASHTGGATAGVGTVDPYHLPLHDQVMGHDRMPKYKKSQSLPLQPCRKTHPYDDAEPHYNSGNFKYMGESDLDRQARRSREGRPPSVPNQSEFYPQHRDPSHAAYCQVPQPRRDAQPGDLRHVGPVPSSRGPVAPQGSEFQNTMAYAHHPREAPKYRVQLSIGSTVLPGVQGLIAGIEMDEPIQGGSDGTWRQTGERYFECEHPRGMHAPLQNLKPDERPSVAVKNSELESLEKENAQLQREKEELQLKVEQHQQRLKETSVQLRRLEENRQQEAQQFVQTERTLQAQVQQLQGQAAQVDRYRDQVEELQAQVERMRLSPDQKLSLQEIEFWKIPRQEVQILDEIGLGAWGYVAKGIFCGREVAVKWPHETILTAKVVDRLRREVRIMAQVRHPNLLLFIAAVFDEQADRLQKPPLIVTELLATDLRSAYKKGNLISSSKLPIFRDIACALNYLHQHHEPIIHRDVSAPNVLLEALPRNQWKAKLSDFGSANLAKLAHTAAEGAIIYAAPETFPPDVHDPRAVIPPQTTKIDVYSYGVLLCEVITNQMPASDDYRSMLQQVQRQWPFMYDLILSCTKRKPEERPTMAGVLSQLNSTP